MFLKKVFIHIPKNAGMTVRRSQALAPYIRAATTDIHKSKKYSMAVKEKMDSTNDHHGFEHARWRDLNRSVVTANGSFAVIRNPWDRVVSRYFFAKKVIEEQGKVSKDYADVSSFEAFLEERHKWGKEKYMWHRAVRGWYPAFDHVSDEEGNIRCDIIRFENLNEDLCSYFKIPKMTEARNVTNMNPGSYKDVYNNKTIQIVADWYKIDIDTWGYDFDTGPTLNYWNKK